MVYLCIAVGRLGIVEALHQLVYESRLDAERNARALVREKDDVIVLNGSPPGAAELRIRREALLGVALSETPIIAGEIPLLGVDLERAFRGQRGAKSQRSCTFRTEYEVRDGIAAAAITGNDRELPAVVYARDVVFSILGTPLHEGVLEQLNPATAAQSYFVWDCFGVAGPLDQIVSGLRRMQRNPNAQIKRFAEESHTPLSIFAQRAFCAGITENEVSVRLILVCSRHEHAFRLAL